jgi:hypothetical protein
MRHINIFLTHEGWAVAVAISALFVALSLPENFIKQLLITVVLWGDCPAGS